jgi:hypothetical protein
VRRLLAQLRFGLHVGFDSVDERIDAGRRRDHLQGHVHRRGRGSVLSGTAIDSKGNADTLTGTATATTVTMTTKNATTASGTISGTTATGTYENTAGNAKGTWTGTAGCGG